MTIVLESLTVNKGFIYNYEEHRTFQSVDIWSPLLSEGEDPPVSGSVGVPKEVVIGVFCTSLINMVENFLPPLLMSHHNVTIGY